MTPFHRFRITLQTTRAVQLPTQQGAVVYALLCAANHDDSQVPESKPSFPGELMTDVPEVCRTHLFSGELFAFGGTILNADSTAAAALLERLCRRLEQLGRQGKPRSHGLGGNFRLHCVEDLVSNTPFAKASFSCVANSHLNEEIQRALPLQEFTLQLCSPVRIEHPRRHRNQGSEHVDEQYFNLPMIIRMLLKRSEALGISLKPNVAPPVIDDATVQLVEKRIQWLDLAYGKQGKRLGGLVGSLRIRISDPVLKAALVWGQYTRLGKNTAFGFGRYRIRELGPEPFACARAVPLLQTAWNHPNADALSAEAGLEAGILQYTFQQISRGDYQPDPVHQLQLDDNTKQRLLQIPSRRDRTLQRLLLEAIGPGWDQLFEASSFAWRRGLGRHSSAQAVSGAWRDGFRYTINADFDRFFESIPHDLLQDRLLGFLQDQPTVDLIMKWVRSAAGDGTKGIPTGAPLSQLLGNLLLDRFDELIQ